ncbi:MAG TPA: zf-HC2 domain-containing protein, partial [Candidatus Angelobacter sp.]|nr:zf-HC2 domain-containing protein [Candidatus Angelobacter sp.]
MSDRPIHPPSEDLFAYRDGELSPEKRALIEAHVMGCSTCRSFIDQVSSLEAELRQSPDRAPAEYLEHLHEAVRARIVASGPVGAAGAEELLDEPEARPALSRDRRGSIRGSRERRGDGPDVSRDSSRIKEAPKLPWAAVLSTASAAAAVLVVVVILMRQGFDHRMPLPAEKARERSVAQAPAVGSKGDRDLKAARDARKKSAEQEKAFLDKSKGAALGKV